MWDRYLNPLAHIELDGRRVVLISAYANLNPLAHIELDGDRKEVRNEQAI